MENTVTITTTVAEARKNLDLYIKALNEVEATIRNLFNVHYGHKSFSYEVSQIDGMARMISLLLGIDLKVVRLDISDSFRTVETEHRMK